MKVLVNITKGYYEAIMQIDSATQFADTLLIKSGTPIPDNATNGDVIKAMFPNVVNSNMDLVDVFNNAKSWWNAPYKAESGEENGKVQ